MSWIETSLTSLERQLRDLIEGDPPTNGIPRKLHRQLERDLLSAMRTAIKTIPLHKLEGRRIAAPDEFTLVMPTQQAALLLNHPRELDSLAAQLQIAAVRAGYQTAGLPILQVVADPCAIQVKVRAGYSHDGQGKTHTALVEGSSVGANGVPAGGSPVAFLIVNGLTTHSLNRTVINIGRDPSNHIRVDDRRVSRMHAQIRLIHGRFVIFDLDSTGGTTVNDVSVTSHVLSPGDVVLLAGVPVVYGHEQVIGDGYTQEVPAAPSRAEYL